MSQLIFCKSCGSEIGSVSGHATSTETCTLKLNPYCIDIITRDPTTLPDSGSETKYSVSVTEYFVSELLESARVHATYRTIVSPDFKELKCVLMVWLVNWDLDIAVLDIEVNESETYDWTPTFRSGIKVMYSFNPTSERVIQWMNNLKPDQLRLAENNVLRIVEELEKSNKFIPEKEREVNGFKVGTMKLYKLLAVFTTLLAFVSADLIAEPLDPQGAVAPSPLADAPSPDVPSPIAPSPIDPSPIPPSPSPEQPSPIPSPPPPPPSPPAQSPQAIIEPPAQPIKSPQPQPIIESPSSQPDYIPGNEQPVTDGSSLDVPPEQPQQAEPQPQPNVIPQASPAAGFLGDVIDPLSSETVIDVPSDEATPEDSTPEETPESTSDVVDDETDCEEEEESEVGTAAVGYNPAYIPDAEGQDVVYAGSEGGYLSGGEGSEGGVGTAAVVGGVLVGAAVLAAAGVAMYRKFMVKKKKFVYDV
ncbi:hypothetical protein HK098_007408 [Nowakowskiella sp. JEL0407]|nr:hypothetical protein HK098_007408 [Nowakowskiella sp. JEL0407]